MIEDQGGPEASGRTNNGNTSHCGWKTYMGWVRNTNYWSWHARIPVSGTDEMVPRWLR